ncbi:MAG: peptide deformylase [Clostridiaceae bacterium]|nr:peptide deformylase [Clostridiaceae bacterium]
MAIRQIRKIGDEVLTKRAREVDKFDDRLATLLDDMVETMRHADGIGLAAPQVGILKRAVVIDVGDGVIELVNPELVAAKGEQVDIEGCLSVPGKYGEVKRPQIVIVRAQDRHGKTFEVTGEGLLARALCHEIDHLDGKLFVDKVIRFVDPEEREND